MDSSYFGRCGALSSCAVISISLSSRGVLAEPAAAAPSALPGTASSAQSTTPPTPAAPSSTSAAPVPPSASGQAAPPAPAVPPASASPPPPGSYYGPPPPYPYGPYAAPPVLKASGPDPHTHRHDGFYFRIGTGPGYGLAKTSGSIGATNVTAHYAGGGPVYELLFGGTVASGFVVGGGFLGQDIWDPKMTIDSNDPNMPSTLSVNGGFGVLALGPFVDWFPDDTGGAHVGAMFGLGGIGLKDRSGDPDTGVGGSVWTGYDFWIANQWSLGAEIRAVFARGTRDVEDPSTAPFTVQTTQFEDSAASYELVVTALLH